MTIRLKITNEDHDPTRGVHIYRDGFIVAELMAGQSTQQNVWTQSSLAIKEFYLKSKPE